MSLADYEHLNEDARHVWWQEEGRHGHDGVPAECRWCGMIPDESHYEMCPGPPDDVEGGE